MAEQGPKKTHIYVVQLLFVAVMFGPRGFAAETMKECLPIVSRFLIYLLVIRGSREGSNILYNAFYSKKQLNYAKLAEENRKYLIMFAASSAVMLYLRESLIMLEFLRLFVAHLVLQYPEMLDKERQPMINYGVGMACSFFEGYLTHIIPSDGSRFVGFQENINIFEARQGVVFPVKRLFIVITKSLYCPPDLKHFNKMNREDLPYLEAVQSLEDVEKDVAGVKNRTYRNSAYKIYRPAGPPVFVTAEFATPLHTLHKVLEKRALYDRLCDVNVPEIVEDFCEQLVKTIGLSPDCRGKCELVHYDDTNPDENLADVLLAKIRELEPNFEEVISKRKVKA